MMTIGLYHLIYRGLLIINCYSKSPFQAEDAVTRKYKGKSDEILHEWPSFDPPKSINQSTFQIFDIALMILAIAFFGQNP